MDSDYIIRRMTPEDFKAAAAIANEEFWNESEHDAIPYLSIDPDVFFVGELKGEIIAAICGVKYSNYAHIGLYLMKKEYRGKGYGLKLFEKAMEHVKGTKLIGLDAAPEQVKNYEKWGFKIHGKGLGFKRKAEGVRSKNHIDIKDVSFSQLVEYDEKCFGESRSNLLKALISQEGYYGLGLVKERELKGYGFLRKTLNGYKIGTFVADDKETTEEILSGLQSLVAGEEVCIDTLENNTEMQEVMKKQEWTERMFFYRMYTEGMRELDLTKAYAVILELG